VEEKGGQVIVFGGQYERPKSIIDAISELEQYSAVLGTEEVPESFFTFKQKWEFFEVGFRDAFVSGLISALFTPIAMGVIHKLIPIFGEYPPSLFDRIFAFALALGFPIGYALLIASLGRYYHSNKITKVAINTFLTGLFTGTAFKAVIAFLGFHFIYFFVFTPQNLARCLYALSGRTKLTADLYQQIYSWLLEFREVFIPSAYFVVFVSLLFIAIPCFSIFYYGRKLKKEKKFLEDFSEL